MTRITWLSIQLGSRPPETFLFRPPLSLPLGLGAQQFNMKCAHVVASFHGWPPCLWLSHLSPRPSDFDRRHRCRPLPAAASPNRRSPRADARSRRSRGHGRAGLAKAVGCAMRRPASSQRSRNQPPKPAAVNGHDPSSSSNTYLFIMAMTCIEISVAILPCLAASGCPKVRMISACRSGETGQ
jgi:hypothetical protein